MNWIKKYKTYLKSKDEENNSSEEKQVEKTENKDLTQKGANYLKHAGIEYVIHGHVNVFSGHQLSIVEGVKHIMCDCTIDRNSRKKHNMEPDGWAYLEVDLKKEKIIGFSSEGTTYFN